MHHTSWKLEVILVISTEACYIDFIIPAEAIFSQGVKKLRAKYSSCFWYHICWDGASALHNTSRLNWVIGFCGAWFWWSYGWVGCFKWRVFDESQIIQGLTGSHLDVRDASMKGFIRFNLQLECDYASWVLTYRCVRCTDVIDVLTGYLEIDSYREWFAERHYTGENRFGWSWLWNSWKTVSHYQGATAAALMWYIWWCSRSL